MNDSAMDGPPMGDTAMTDAAVDDTAIHDTSRAGPDSAAAPPPTERLLHSLEALRSSEVLDGAGEPRGSDTDPGEGFGQPAQALVRRAVVEQAKGMLMQHYGLDAERAVVVLRRWSDDTGTGMETLADSLVHTATEEDRARVDDQRLLRWIEQRLLRGLDGADGDAGAD